MAKRERFDVVKYDKRTNKELQNEPTAFSDENRVEAEKVAASLNAKLTPQERETIGFRIRHSTTNTLEIGKGGYPSFSR